MLETFLSQIQKYVRLLTFWDVKNSLNKIQAMKVALTLMLNIWTSFAKILAPATMAKAVEMFATNEEAEDFLFLELTAKELLFISLMLSIWLKAEIHVKNLILQDTEKAVIHKNSMRLIKLSHQVTLDQHYSLRVNIPTMLMDVINLQSRLPKETATIIYQGIFDIVLGSSLIWHRYGNIIGLEFLAYCVSDLILIDYLIVLVTKQNQKFTRMNHTLHKFINREFEILNYAETVRMFNHEELELIFSEKSLEKCVTANSHYQFSERISSFLKLLPFCFTTLIPLSFLYKDNITVSDLDEFIFLLSYLNMFSSNIFSLSQATKSCLRAVDSIIKMNTLVNQYKNETPRRMQMAQIDLPIFEIKCPPPLIEFKNITYTYPNNKEPTIKDFNLLIRPGKTLGIIGRSNVGKSTLIKLLYGFLKPQSGTIKINGYELERIPREILCKIFCCVPQNPELFRDKSLKYNVLYGTVLNDFLLKTPGSKTKDYENRLGKINVYDSIISEEEEVGASENCTKANKLFSNTMQQVNLDSLIIPGSSKKLNVQNLSGGQRQRLSIARALVRNSSVFILDEAFSALDSFTERQVLNNIQEVAEGKTKILITHRLSNLKEADEVIVLENGTIVEQGPPEDLLQEEGLYYRYWREQRV